MISSTIIAPIGKRKVESMHAQKRQNEILNTVRLRGACSIMELAKELQVSDETIRRTIKPLVAQGMISRVHGGIVLNENLQEPPFQHRMQENLEAKRSIAQLVLKYIKDGDSIMIDTGSTTAYVAHDPAHPQQSICGHQLHRDWPHPSSPPRQPGTHHRRRATRR